MHSLTQTLSDASLKTFALWSESLVHFDQLQSLACLIPLARRVQEDPKDNACCLELQVQVFGPAAQQALKHKMQVNKVSRKFADLHFN